MNQSKMDFKYVLMLDDALCIRRTIKEEVENQNAELKKYQIAAEVEKREIERKKALYKANKADRLRKQLVKLEKKLEKEMA